MANTQRNTAAKPPPVKFDQELGSSSGTFRIDVVPELVSRLIALKTYDQMAFQDSTTSVSLRASKSAILGGEFYVDPAGSDQQSVDIAEFVSDNLFESLQAPFIRSVAQICRNFQHGTSALEPVWELRRWAPNRKMANGKNMTMLKKLANRPIPTIKDFEVDNNGELVQVIQNAIQTGGKTVEVKIPKEKILTFPIGDADDYWGQSLLRSAYPHWFYKTHLYRVDAIQKERHGIGIPTGTLPPGYTPQDREFFVQMLRNIRTNEKAEVALPPGYEWHFAKLEGQLVDVLKSATHHDFMVMLNFLVEFLVEGAPEAGSGGRATSGTQQDVYYKTSQFYANGICDQINKQLIPNMVLYNFEVDDFPELKVRNIGQSKELQQIAAALANLAAQDVIIPDETLEDWTRDLFDAPRRTTPRPEFGSRAVRELIQKTIAPTGQAAATNGQANPKGKVGGNGGQGNTGKGTDAPNVT